MKKIKRMVAVAAVVLLSAQLSEANVFAVNPYNIYYEGGNPLSANNVSIEPESIDQLVPLLNSDVVSTTPVYPENWEDGYVKDSGVCYPSKYYTIHEGFSPMLSGAPDSHSFTISNGKFRADVDILNEVTEYLGEGDYAIAIRPNLNFIYAGWSIYSDANCENAIDYISPLNYNDGRIFLELKSTLYKEDTIVPFVTNALAFGISDIDAAQSYKILSEGNELNPEIMFASSAESLQPEPGIPFKNMFVDSDGYIYSEYDPVTKDHIETTNRSNIYVQLYPSTQADGVHFVFGFAGNAASGIEYYTIKHKVQYDTDANGEITGIVDEDRYDGEYASGSLYRAKNSYRFSHWVADVDVFLEDGTLIRAGEPITSEQIKTVVVDRDIKFTAIFEIDVAVPNTGASTSETNAVAITFSAFGILLGALLIRFLPRFTHRKIGFDK
ncbi:hypothetical protein IJG12_01990 [Candidatus Saccharibacteria bacterium]|nr:hypothetical protein [Candidatus Saccharibacteria bacterium]